MTTWSTCPERPGDEAAVREILTAAFPTTEEADLVDALRADPSAWVEGLSVVAHDAQGPPAPPAQHTPTHDGGAEGHAHAPCAT
ncbi:MAG: GNAT family N-acetyltransferase, partial [Brachybacterium tyrofermentans]